MTEKLYNFIMNLSTTLQWLLLIVCVGVGFLVLVKGADFLVGSASNIAKVLKIPSLVVGLTIVAFGTSAPEVSVSIVGAINGSEGISVGNVVGSNIFNLLVVLGVFLASAPIVLSRKVVLRDVGMMLLTGVLLLLFSFAFGSKGNRALVWFEGITLLALFVAYLTMFVRGEMKAQRQAEIARKELDKTDLASVEEQKEERTQKVWVSFTVLVISLGAIVLGGSLLNCGAKGIAVSLGVSENLAGLTVCAVGTSLPELVTSIVAIKRKENDIALGNVLGSNIFNALVIFGVCALISPLTLDAFGLVDIIIMAVIYLAFFGYCLFAKKTSRAVGVAMISAYLLFAVFIVLREIYPIVQF